MVLSLEATTTNSNPADAIDVLSVPRSMAVHVENDAYDDLHGDITHSDEMKMTMKPETTNKKCNKGLTSTSIEERMDDAAVKAQLLRYTCSDGIY
jgi:hypothetical protein